jgi:hypothetical protein
MQDLGRQMAYGMQHLRYFLLRKPERRDEMQHALNKSEAVFTYEWSKDTPLREALLILLGGGTSPEQLADGNAKFAYFWKRWINDYAFRLEGAGLERRDRMHPSLREHLPQTEEEAQVAA